MASLPIATPKKVGMINDSPDDLDEIILDLIDEIQTEGQLTEDQAYVALTAYLSGVNIGEAIRLYESSHKKEKAHA